MTWTTVVGLEIHAQLATRTKMFCSCKREAGAAANQHICPVCVGWPGALPVLQSEAIRCAIRAALCLNCEIQELSRFDRQKLLLPRFAEGLPDQSVLSSLCIGGWDPVHPGRR